MALPDSGAEPAHVEAPVPMAISLTSAAGSASTGSRSDVDVGASPLLLTATADASQTQVHRHVYQPLDEIQATSYTRHGMNATLGAPVRGRWEGGRRFYYKELSQPEVMLARYEMLARLGVGVPFERVTPTTIRMTGGHTIQKVVAERIVGSQGRRAIADLLVKIHQLLRDNRWAHTDVKPSNIIVKYRKQDLTGAEVRFAIIECTLRHPPNYFADPTVWLIDNDYALPFGEVRIVGTLGINISPGGEASIVDADTDNMGFDSTYRYLGQAYGFGLPRVTSQEITQLGAITT